MALPSTPQIPINTNAVTRLGYIISPRVHATIAVWTDSSTQTPGMPFKLSERSHVVVILPRVVQ